MSNFDKESLINVSCFVLLMIFSFGIGFALGGYVEEYKRADHELMKERAKYYGGVQ